MVLLTSERTERRTFGGLRIIQEHAGDSPGRSGLHAEFKLRVDPGPGYRAEETARNSRGTLAAPEEQQIQTPESGGRVEAQTPSCWSSSLKSPESDGLEPTCVIRSKVCKLPSGDLSALQPSFP